jgi:DNA-binding transcriptional ArsR family regulator
MEAGWTVLPSVILERQKALGLDAIDVNILLHLARYWWFHDRPPFPAKATIAECMGIDRSTVRRHIAALEKDGLIRREPRYKPERGGQDTNAYHFDGLIREATQFAVEAVKTREQRRVEDAVTRRRKKPSLVVDNTKKAGGKKR